MKAIHTMGPRTNSYMLPPSTPEGGVKRNHLANVGPVLHRANQQSLPIGTEDRIPECVVPWAPDLAVDRNSETPVPFHLGGHTLAGWGEPVASASAVDGDAIFTLDGAEGTWVLLWVTDLGEGPGRVEVQELTPVA